MKYNDNGEWREIITKNFDTLPVGAIVEYTGTTIPSGWTSIGNNQIQKTSQYIEGGASLSNVYGTSQSNGYTQEYINGLETYSTTEKRIGTWIDGKPIYRKVINFGALPNASTKSVSHNISNLGTIIDIKGTGTNGSFWFKFPHLVQDTPTNGIEISVSTTLIYIKTGSDRSAYSAYVTLEYTKTTD